MLQYLIDHPWLLALLGAPALIKSLPGLLRKLEVAALRRLVEKGDEIDREALKGTLAVWVTWAEKKYGAGKGPVKFEAVDGLLSKALPFLSAEDRKHLIEESVKQLDEGAHEASQ